MLWIFAFLAALATVKGQADITGAITVDDIDSNDIYFNDTNTYEKKTYLVPGAIPGLTLFIVSPESARYAADPVSLYQSIFIVSPIICKENPATFLANSLQLPGASMTVTFRRVRPQHKTITYGELCTGLRGIGEYITQDKAYYEQEIRLVPANLEAVNCDILVTKNRDVVQPSIQVS